MPGLWMPADSCSGDFCDCKSICVVSMVRRARVGRIAVTKRPGGQNSEQSAKASGRVSSLGERRVPRQPAGGADRGLLGAATSVMLLIDPVRPGVPGDGAVSIGALAPGIEPLCRCSRYAEVPVLTSVFKDAGVFPSEGLIDGADISFQLREVFNPWDDEELVAALDDHDRNDLVLIGGWCGVTVVMTALCALAYGYDVHVVTDCCPGLTDDEGAPAMHRLLQFGVTPVSWRQVVFEWMRHRPELTERDFLQEVLGGDERTAPWIDLLGRPSGE